MVFFVAKSYYRQRDTALLRAIQGHIMNNKLQQLLEQLIPFILFGIAIALVIGLFIMISYVLVWGIMLGAIIWAGYAIKNYFFPPYSPEKKDGRIIEHDDDIK